MHIEMVNLRRSGAVVLVDAEVTSATRSVYPVTLRVVGTRVQPSIASTLPPELMAQIFAAAREFVEKNQEKVSALFFGADRTNP